MWIIIGVYVATMSVLIYIVEAQRQVSKALREKLTDLQRAHTLVLSENHAITEVLREQGFKVYTSTVALGDDVEQIKVKVVRIDVENGSVH